MEETMSSLTTTRDEMSPSSMSNIPKHAPKEQLDESQDDSSHFSTLSSVQTSNINQSTILNRTGENKGDPHASFHSLQCEIQLWQEAYQTAQETHATRIKQLLSEQKEREDEIRKEMKMKWDVKFEE